jgi:hypothetical protein
VLEFAFVPVHLVCSFPPPSWNSLRQGDVKRWRRCMPVRFRFLMTKEFSYLATGNWLWFPSGWWRAAALWVRTVNFYEWSLVRLRFPLFRLHVGLFWTRAKERERVGKAQSRDVSSEFFLQNGSLVWRLRDCSGTSSLLLLAKYCCSVNQNSEFCRVKLFLFFSESNLNFLLKRRSRSVNEHNFARQNSLFCFTNPPCVFDRIEDFAPPSLN